jgi:hypothetical protein
MCEYRRVTIVWRAERAARRFGAEDRAGQQTLSCALRILPPRRRHRHNHAWAAAALLDARTDLSVEYIKKITRVGINSMPPHNRIELPDSELDLIAVYLTRPASARAAESSGSSGKAHE